VVTGRRAEGGWAIALHNANTLREHNNGSQKLTAGPHEVKDLCVLSGGQKAYALSRRDKPTKKKEIDQTNNGNSDIIL
jgi:hypothetical protein